MLLDQWLSETGCSALPKQIKELCCYLTIAQWTQANSKTLCYSTSSGQVFELEHAKVISLSAFLCGDPGSYKSEAIRLISRVCSEYNNLVLQRFPKDQLPIPLFPHDKVTNEYLLTSLAHQTLQLPEGSPTISTIIIDEAINFLNKRDYVEPLVGTLNSLVDQPLKYSTGTQKRQAEFIRLPIVSILLACAPGWFKHLPEALFNGGWTGRCMFYYVPYAEDDERQPRGRVVESGGSVRLAEGMYHLPKGQLTLTPSAISLYDDWERRFGKFKVHPLPAVDEWFKRRAIMAIRLAGCIALSKQSLAVNTDHMLEADLHMEHVLSTLESVWQLIDADDGARYQNLVGFLRGRKLSESELLNLAVDKMKSTQRAMNILRYMKDSSILIQEEFGKWQLRIK